MPTPNITRRAALTGTAAGAAAIVAGTGPVIADEHDRAEWLALWSDYVRKERALSELPDDHTDEDAELINDARWAAGSVIEDKPATTLVGLAVKLAYAVYWDGQFASTTDLDTSLEANNHTALIAVYRDAVRLAELPEEMWREPFHPRLATDLQSSGAAYVTAYEELRMRVSTGVDAQTGQSTGIVIWEPDPPHSDDEQERHFALNKTVWADPAGNRKMADYCIASGRTYPVSGARGVQS